MLCPSLEPWERQYLGVWWDGGPLTDEDAIYKFPDHSWIYDKHELGLHLGYSSALIVPPVFIKPATNFDGLGRGSLKIDEDMVVQPYRTGAHLSTDVWVEHGIAKAWWTMEGLKDEHNNFWMFKSVAEDNDVHKICAQLLDGYTGYFNYETIGGYVIEAHLRPSMQFFDICGDLIQNKKVSLQEQTYSRVYMKEQDTVFTTLPTIQLVKDVRSVQFCFEPGVPLSRYAQPPNAYRYLIINGTDPAAIDQQFELINNALEEL